MYRGLMSTTIKALCCQVCKTVDTPGAGFLPGPKGITQQVAFWCLECAAQIPVSDEWLDAEFVQSVMWSLNPFADIFPSEAERLASCRRTERGLGRIPTGISKAWLEERLDEGVTCPTCGQHAQRYRRRFNSSMSRWLIILAKLSPRYQPTWTRTSDVIKRAASLRGFGTAQASGEAPSLLPFWGLIETRPNTDTDKKHSGVWRPTEKGHDFVDGKVVIPRVAVVYNNTLERLEGDSLSIREALGKRFSYEELMNAVA
jgi:hypothetical protein